MARTEDTRQDALITRKAAAEQLGVSEQTVARLNKSGALPAIAVTPSVVRLDPEDLAQFIASRKSHAD